MEMGRLCHAQVLSTAFRCAVLFLLLFCEDVLLGEAQLVYAFVLDALLDSFRLFVLDQW